MPTITAVTMTITLIMSLVVLPKLHQSSLEADVLFLLEERELLQALLAERNDWMLRHLVCGAGAAFMIWIGNSVVSLEISARTAAALAVYAFCSLFFALLESLLAQKIADLLSRVPVRVKTGD